MALLKTTYVSGNLFATGSNEYISSSEFRGPLTGTASWAISASEAVHAISASALNPEADLFVKTLHVSGNAQVDGDLKVLGDLTYVGVKDLRVNDKTIELNVDDSGSASAAANGAGIIIRNSDPEGDITLIYSASDDKLHFNKGIAGTIDSASEATHAVSASRADSAAQADKVAFKLSFGDGLNGGDYDGSGNITASLDTSSVKNIKVNSASRADSAENADSADKVANALHIKVQHSGSEAVESDYDGSSVVSASVDFTSVEATQLAHSASIAQLRADVDAMSGGSGSIAEQIQNAIEALDADASAAAEGTPVSGGVFVLSGVAFNEADGKLTSGSATSVEVEKAGAAAAAVAGLSQSVAESISSSNARISTLEAATSSYANSASVATVTKAAEDRIGALEIATGSADDRLDALEAASGSAISRLNALEGETGSYANSASVASEFNADRNRLNALETASATHVTNNTFNAYTQSTDGRLNALETASAELGASYLTTASFNSYTESQAAVDATQSARLDALETASGSAISRLDTLEAATASYAVSASVAAEQLAQNNRLDALETASGSAISRLNALETASATHITETTFNSYTSSVSTSMSASDARLDALEESEASASALYVAKTGDTMTGDLTMSDAGIVMGRMRVIWNAEDQAIEFVPMTS